MEADAVSRNEADDGRPRLGRCWTDLRELPGRPRRGPRGAAPGRAATPAGGRRLEHRQGRRPVSPAPGTTSMAPRPDGANGSERRRAIGGPRLGLARRAAAGGPISVRVSDVAADGPTTGDRAVALGRKPSPSRPAGARAERARAMPAARRLHPSRRRSPWRRHGACNAVRLWNRRHRQSMSRFVGSAN